MLKIIDNFFENPHAIRQVGLNLLSERHNCILNDTTDNYPGIRCPIPKSISELVIKLLEKNLNAKIKSFVGSFHLTSNIHKLGLIHFDRTDKYAGLVYLNENPPNHSGTMIYNPIVDSNVIAKKKIPDFFKIASTTHDIDIITEFTNHKENFNKNFKPETEIENKFNRVAMYDSIFYHAPCYYFGNNLFNSRLVLVFWFNVV
jgi:hypothetical protein